MNKFWWRKRGSALLTAVLVMAVLLAVSIAVSSLVMRELSLTAQLLNAGKAYYLAEAGLEKALLGVKKNLPGWEGPVDNVKFYDSSEAKFTVKVKATCKTYPCVDDLPNGSKNNKVLYYETLDLNETVNIPLFTASFSSSSAVSHVNDFVVQFYGNFAMNDLKGVSLSGWDVLRWKLFALVNNNGDWKTDEIGDFTALSSGTNADSPSWFGTKSCGTLSPEGGIECVSYAPAPSGKGAFCDVTQARDQIVYGSIDGRAEEVRECLPISDFMNLRQTGLKYLSLTNLMNPAMFNNDIGSEQQKLRKARIYYRVVALDDGAKLPKPVVEISATGEFRGVKQTISLYQEREKPLPVMNFAIYQY